MNSTVFEMIIRVFGAVFIYLQFCGSPSGSAPLCSSGWYCRSNWWICLSACNTFWQGDVMASLYSAVAAAVVSHIFARVYKTPVTLFLIAGVLPTVPGNGMYQTVHYLIDGNEAMSEFYLIQTLEIAGVISLAIFCRGYLFPGFSEE